MKRLFGITNRNGLAMRPLCAAMLLAYLPASWAATQDGVSATAARDAMLNDAGKKTVSSAPLLMASAAPLLASVQFDSSFLMSSADRAVDVSRYETGNPVMPGEYRSDVYLNGRLIGRESLVIRADAEGRAQVCFNRALLERLNVDTSKLDSGHVAEFAQPDGCLDLSSIVSGASVTFNQSDLRLDVDIPQASLQRTARGYVDPALWDEGATSARLSYTANLYRNEFEGSGAANSGYLGLNAGFNMGGWTFRHSGTLTWSDGGGHHYESARRHYNTAYNYVQHDVTRWKSRVTLGDSYTNGELFDTFAYRGVQLASDDRMLPDSMRGYAPVVRGVAETNARVTIRQNGYVLYDTAVPAGPFVIDDLYPTGYGGDLDVSIIEADGRVRTFRVPYASVAQALRPGMTRYNLMAGSIRSRQLSYTPAVALATVQRGVTNALTLYGGVLASNNYGSVLAGAAVGTPVGAIALDASGSNASPSGARASRGLSIRAAYSKLITQTDSNVSVAAYRFSSTGYLDLNDALTFINNARTGQSDMSSLQRARNRLSVTASQGLGHDSRWGQLFVSGYIQDYWTRPGRDTQFQIGHVNRIGAVNYGVSVERVRTGGGAMDTRYMVNLSLPLGRTLQAPTLSFNVVNDRSSGTAVQTLVNGVAGEDNQIGYAAGVTRDGGARYAGNLSGQYRAPYTNLQAGFSTGSGYKSVNAGVSGSIVAHPRGVTASAYTADTIGIVSAPGGAGAVVTGYPGVKLDANGNAVVPYLTPYRLNEVTLDPKGTDANIELQTTSRQVAPRLGAVVMLDYPTVTGRPVLIRSHLPDGNALPFGAPVSDGKGNNIGMVTQGGMVYARINGLADELKVTWGASPSAYSCVIRVRLPEHKAGDNAMAFERLEAPCEMTEGSAPSSRQAGKAGKSADGLAS
ncbi:fimbria/pilus outer membrane usher protein [Paraburkholderia xenovorans]|nr:fimbria/pilus outer membrane usher protein [Paraburkholderia xenovorans]